MSRKFVPPSIKERSFSCAICGSLCVQSWFEIHGRKLDATPKLVSSDAIENLDKEIEKKRAAGEDDVVNVYEGFKERTQLLLKGVPLIRRLSDSKYCHYDIDNIHVSRCYSCGEITIWRFDSILYPAQRYDIEPNEDMNDDIRADFNEARDVLSVSPRAATALLRLCIQKLCKQLGLPGKNIDADIAELVRGNLDPRVQKALDIVRVVGNNAVHPGELYLKDDRDTAVKLFQLVNRIAYDLITHPKEVDALYEEKIPQTNKDAIARRDAPKNQ